MRPAAVPLRPLVPLCLAALATCLTACGGATQAERSAAKMQFLPSHIETTWKFQGDARTAKVRVYADAEVRALPHWKDDIGEEIDYANQLLEPMIGLRLT